MYCSWEGTRLEAGRAVDGDGSDDYSPGTRNARCSHTNEDERAWWAVDMGAAVSVSAARLVPRGLTGIILSF